jgi:poly(A) polymerase Pap1
MKKEVKSKALEREIYALRHQVAVKDKLIQRQKADMQIKDAQIQSSTMFISYLASQLPAKKENEIEIPMKDLYEFAAGYDVKWKKDDTSDNIVIRIDKKGDEQHK